MNALTHTTDMVVWDSGFYVPKAQYPLNTPQGWGSKQCAMAPWQKPWLRPMKRFIGFCCAPCYYLSRSQTDPSLDLEPYLAHISIHYFAVISDIAVTIVQAEVTAPIGRGGNQLIPSILFANLSYFPKEFAVTFICGNTGRFFCYYRQHKMAN